MSETEPQPQLTAEQLKEKEISKYVNALTMSFVASQGNAGVQTEFFNWYAEKNRESIDVSFLNQNEDEIKGRFKNIQMKRLVEGSGHKSLDIPFKVTEETDIQFKHLIKAIETPESFDHFGSMINLLGQEAKYQFNGRKRKAKDGQDALSYDSLFREMYLNTESSPSMVFQFYDAMVSRIKDEGEGLSEVKIKLSDLKRGYKEHHQDEFDPLNKLGFLYRKNE